MPSTMTSSIPAPPVDESVYTIREEEKQFFKLTTRIHDDEELRKHICKIQARAYETFPYPCIRAFYFLNFQLCHYPRYKEILELGRKRSNAIYLEVGCAFGTDIRKLVADGFPLENILGLDIHGEYYDLGHQLFNTTPETYPFAFITRDIFDPSNLAPKCPDSITKPLPPLRSLNSLMALHNRVSIIHASSVFHLFPPEKQKRLAYLFASLLSPLPGSLIIGRQLATKEGIFEWDFGNATGRAWSYSISAWKDLWIGNSGPFKAEEVDAQVTLMALPTEVGNAAVGKTTPNVQFLDWSITKL